MRGVTTISGSGTKKELVSTPYAINCFFCHGDITQMSNVSTARWVKEKDAHESWALSEQRSDAGADHHSRSIKIAPKVALLGASLFNDPEGRFERHIVRASRLTHAGPRNFSLHTPSRASSTIRRTWKILPSCSRFKQGK